MDLENWRIIKKCIIRFKFVILRTDCLYLIMKRNQFDVILRIHVDENFAGNIKLLLNIFSNLIQ